MASNLRELAAKFPEVPLYSGLPAVKVKNAPRGTRQTGNGGGCNNKVLGLTSGESRSGSQHQP